MIDERWLYAQRVLAVRLDNLGDVLVTTPALHAIKESLPRASLSLLTSPVGAQVARLNPDLDHVLVHEAPWMDPWSTLPQSSERESAIIAAIRERHFDGAIIFTSFRQSSLPSAYLCYLADIPLRVAASIDGPGSLLTTRHRHPEQPIGQIMHEVERGLDLVASIGMSTTQTDLVLAVPEDERSRAVQIISDSRPPCDTGPTVILHPGCTMPARTYPWEMYVEVADLLIEKLGATVLVTGSRDERALAERIQARMRHPATVLAGEMTFPTFCGVIQAADLTITNNTGPMHISSAVKTPVVALFALTNPPQQWGPWQVPYRQLFHDVPCRICYSRICPYEHECLRLVTPDMVLTAAEELLWETAWDRNPQPVTIGRPA